MQVIKEINSAINGVVWGVPMLVLLVGAGLFLTIRNRGVQFRHFGYAMKNTLGKIFHKVEAGEGAVTPFQAVTTALAATVGTGNIAGVIAAITLGGPGAVFWLWVSALVGMCTKYAEVVLAIKFRERNSKGDWVGGPMYYITNGLGKNWKWLAYTFCVFGCLAAFGIGNAVQVGNITDSINNAISVFNPNVNTDAVNITVGIILAILTALVVIGGVKRLGRVTEKMIPFMSLIYIISSLIVVFMNLENLGQVFRDIFVGAFNPSAVVGGVAGVTLKTAITWGVKRGVFSNEAGLGSAPIAHAAAETKDPVSQGMYGIFEVFVDSIVICTLSALPVLICGIDIQYGVQGTTSLVADAFATVYGAEIAALLIAVAITLFAASTIFGWALYGTRCAEYLFGTKFIKVYQIIFVLVVIVGATMDLGLAWDIADTLNGLMAIPNLIALIGLSGVVVKLTREHFDKQKLKK